MLLAGCIESVCVLILQGYDVKNKERCDTMENLVQHGCDASYIVSHEHEIDYTKVGGSTCMR